MAGLLADGVVQVTLTISTTVTVINLVFGLLIAWVLKCYSLASMRLSICRLRCPPSSPGDIGALYGTNSQWENFIFNTATGVGVALAFVTLPFVVRRAAGAAGNRSRAEGGGGVAEL